jgi:hypothetical protein
MTHARHCGDGRLVGQIQHIDGTYDIRKVFAGHMKIDRGRPDTPMSHEPQLAPGNLPAVPWLAQGDFIIRVVAHGPLGKGDPARTEKTRHFTPDIHKKSKRYSVAKDPCGAGWPPRNGLVQQVIERFLFISGSRSRSRRSDGMRKSALIAYRRRRASTGS